jgi:hypothetical protein
MSTPPKRQPSSWTDTRDEWRALREWPPDVRFLSSRTERIMPQRLPPRPEGISRSAMGCGTGACADERFAEDDPGLGAQGNRP